MGPTIILDKSTLQSLSQKENYFLFKHYFVVVTRVLIIEILADLKKGTNKKSPEAQVQLLASKLLSMDSIINAHYVEVCVLSLLGENIPMIGQAFVTGGIPLETPNAFGEKGIFLDEPLERKALRNWQEGNFSETERLLAEEWRKTIQELNLEEDKKRLSLLFKDLPKQKNFEELEKLIESKISNPNPEIQFTLIGSFIEDIGLPRKVKDIIYKRWLEGGLPTFRDFAPYAFYCFKVLSIFKLGLYSDLITTRNTNRIDLEYLFYLPFCMVFSSGDRFHIESSKLFLRDDQNFIDSGTLKRDLQWISDEWDNLSEAEKEERASEYGSYPPNNPESVTYNVWKKLMKPWEPGSGNKVIKMTEDEQKRIIESMRPVFDEKDKIVKSKRNEKE